MLRFRLDTRKLRHYFLPGKEEKDIAMRIRNRSASRAPGENAVKARHPFSLLSRGSCS
jgi:hypothetical protein